MATFEALMGPPLAAGPQARLEGGNGIAEKRKRMAPVPLVFFRDPIPTLARAKRAPSGGPSERYDQRAFSVLSVGSVPPFLRSVASETSVGSLPQPWPQQLLDLRASRSADGHFGPVR